MAVDNSDELDAGDSEMWISPKYCSMKVPALRSFAAKSPFCPFAGWEGVVIGVILTRGDGPLGLLGGMDMASLGRDRRDERCSGVKLGE